MGTICLLLLLFDNPALYLPDFFLKIRFKVYSWTVAFKNTITSPLSFLINLIPYWIGKKSCFTLRKLSWTRPWKPFSFYKSSKIQVPKASALQRHSEAGFCALLWHFHHLHESLMEPISTSTQLNLLSENISYTG